MATTDAMKTSARSLDLGSRSVRILGSGSREVTGQRSNGRVEAAPRYLSRRELHELVWSEPLRTLAAKLGISDVGLAKACRRAHVPIPERGHWQKRRAGKKSSQTPLPPRPLGAADDVFLGGGWRSWSERWTEEEVLGPIPDSPTFSESESEVRARAAALIRRVPVPDPDTRSHGVIAAVLREDDRRREKQRTSTYAYSWEAPLYDSPNQRRRLRIANALFLALTPCGGKPHRLGRESEDFSIEIGNTRVVFALNAVDQRRRPDKKGSPDRSENLTLEIKTFPSIALSSTRWGDEGRRRLENQLAEIAIEFLVCAELQYRHQVRSQYEWRIERKKDLEERARREKAERERQERERQAELQRQRVERLLREADALRQARAIRQYVEEAQAELSRSVVDVSTHELEAWAGWALRQADAIDPVRSRAFLEYAQESKSDPQGEPCTTESSQT